MLKYRAISGLIFGIGALLAAFWLPVPGVWLLLVALSCIGQLEFYAIMEKAGIPVSRYFGLFFGILLISATCLTLLVPTHPCVAIINLENAVILFALLTLFIRQFPQKNNVKPLETIACTLMGIGYVPYLMNYITRMAYTWHDTAPLARAGETGRSLVIYLIVVVKVSDIAAYATGRLIGKHKLFPRLSPGKTWEGFIGGVFGSILISLGLYTFWSGHLGILELSLVDALVLGTILPVIGVVGDIFESLLKRAAGAKDSSAAIPGMGGFLDVLDSLLFTAPILYFYAKVFMQ